MSEKGVTAKPDRKAAILEHMASGDPATYRQLRRIAKAAGPIRELVEEGKIVRLALGVYALPAREASWDAFAALAARNPGIVIHGPSAAAYHGLTTENPHEVWVAVPYNSSVPKSAEISIRGSRWREKSMTCGIEEVEIGGVKVKMTSPERTVVDYLRSMDRTGEQETALEALSSFKGRTKDLYAMAKEFGVEKTVRLLTQAAASGLGRNT